MNWRLAERVLFVLGAATPCAALYSAHPIAPGDVNLALAPFAAPELVLIHVLAAAPFCLLLARAIRHEAPRGVLARIAPLWILIGAALAAATVAGGDAVGPVLDKIRAGFELRLFARVAWCVVLAFPWFLAAVSWGPPDQEKPAPGGARIAALLLTLVVAVVPPATYAHELIEKQSALANAQWRLAIDHWPRARLAAIEPAVALLADLGGDQRIGGELPRRARELLAEQIARHAETAHQRLPENADEAKRIEQAQHLAVIGELAAAREAVQPLAEHNAVAALTLGVLLDEQGEWVASQQAYERAVHLLEGETDAEMATYRVQAYDGLAKVARELGEYAQAEEAYQAAIRALPETEAYFSFQLGRHYHLGGRTAKAAAAYTRAAELDPRQYGRQTARLVDDLRRGTPSCLLPRGSSAEPRR